MWLYPSITTENAIQQNNRPCYFRSRSKKKNIIDGDPAIIKNHLLTTSIQISRFCSTDRWHIMNDADIINCYPFTRNTNAIYCIENFNVSSPSIRQATHGECTMMSIVDSN